MHKSIGYHTRKRGEDSSKVTGGSFGGAIDIETINRLVNTHKFKVEIAPTGFATFVDSSGRKVALYLTVDPLSTDIGKVALSVHREAQRIAQAAEDEKAQQVQNLLTNYSNDELLALLKKEK